MEHDTIHGAAVRAAATAGIAMPRVEQLWRTLAMLDALPPSGRAAAVIAPGGRTSPEHAAIGGVVAVVVGAEGRAGPRRRAAAPRAGAGRAGSGGARRRRGRTRRASAAVSPASSGRDQAVHPLAQARRRPCAHPARSHSVAASSAGSSSGTHGEEAGAGDRRRRSRLSGRSQTPSRSSARRAPSKASRAAARSVGVGRRRRPTTAGAPPPVRATAGCGRPRLARLSGLAGHAGGRRPARSRRRRPRTSPAAAMRESAVRVVPSEIPNSSVVRTRSCTGRRGGSMPSSTDSSTERAVRLLRLLDMCRRVYDAGRMALTMVPDTAVLPDVLPTERLLESGKPVPAIRQSCAASTTSATSAASLLCWAQAAAIIGGGDVAGPPARLPGRRRAHGCDPRPLRHPRPRGGPQAAVHRQAGQRLVGRWLLAYPAFVPLEAYRRSHFAHHKDEFGPNEPDINLYNGYPITQSSLRRKLWRDARGTSGWKSLKPLFLALRSGGARPVAGRILGTQVVLLLAATARRPTRALPRPVAAAVDDVVAGDQPAAQHRRARRHGAQRRSPPHHPPRRASPGSPGSGSCRSTPAGTSPTTSTWACRGATCRPCTPSWSPPAR